MPLTNKNFADLITFTRTGDTATRVNSLGQIESVAADTPRFDYDPVALEAKGLLIEGARTNLLLNSTIDGASLSTQSVSVSATAHTLSFYGSGTVTLSGAHSAVLAGAGDYPSRATLTFTPSAGSLTVTVSGDVEFAQLEEGAFATSFIPTAAATATRATDNASITGTAFSDWYNASEGTVYVEGSSAFVGDSGLFALESNSSNQMSAQFTSGGSFEVIRLGVTQAQITGASPTAGVVSKFACAFKQNDVCAAMDGVAGTTDTSVLIPTVDTLQIGNRLGGGYLNGHIKDIRFYPTRLSNAELQELTA